MLWTVVILNRLQSTTVAVNVTVAVEVLEIARSLCSYHATKATFVPKSTVVVGLVTRRMNLVEFAATGQPIVVVTVLGETLIWLSCKTTTATVNSLVHKLY